MRKSKKTRNKIILWSIISVALLVGLIAILYVTAPGNIVETDYTQIKFSGMYETINGSREVAQNLKNLNGKKVKLSGYMAEQSPIDKSFIYLVSQPYVVCPFCTVGDITKLEVMSVLRADGGGIEFRNNPVEIYGTLEVEPKKDVFDYTTQFRIIADKIVNLEESNENATVNAYYNQLNEAGMIFDIQTLQMTLDSIVNPEAILMYYETNDPVKVIDKIKEDTMWDFSEYVGYPTNVETGMDGYVNYIKECPDIVASIMPEDEKLIALNEELIDIYNRQIELMEDIAVVVNDIKAKEMTDEEKNTTYTLLTSYCDRNIKLFEDFTNWNNKLRE